PEGKASYLVQKNAGGRGSKQYKITFGEYPAMDLPTAINKAHMLIAQIRNGVAVPTRTTRLQQLRIEQAQSKTFKEVYELYYNRHKQPGRYWEKHIPYTFNLDILPTFGPIPITSITKQDCRALIRKREETSKSMP